MTDLPSRSLPSSLFPLPSLQRLGRLYIARYAPRCTLDRSGRCHRPAVRVLRWPSGTKRHCCLYHLNRWCRQRGLWYHRRANVIEVTP